MQIVLFGLSHDVADVSLRERVSLTGHDASEALAEILVQNEGISEAAVLSTCNRTEFYLVTDEPAAARGILTAFLARRCDLPLEEVVDSFMWRCGQEAVSHLFRVASGLESQILGEGQILGQVRDAAKTAREAWSLGPLLESLFRHAVTAGKRVRTDTTISQGAVSVGSAAVELAKETLGGLHGRTALLVGAGKIGEVALKHLASQGVTRIMVANRTLESATQAARVVGGEAVAFIDLQKAIAQADVVLCCTGAPHYILTGPEFGPIAESRGGRPLVMVDVSVPRNIDPEIGKIAGVSLFDVDDLKAVAERNRDERAYLLPIVEAIVGEEMVGWAGFLRSYEAAPTITGLRQKVEAMRAQEFEGFARDMAATLSPEQLAAVEHLTRALTAKFLHQPTVSLRDKGDQLGGHAAAIRDLFGLAAPVRGGRRLRSAKG